MARRSPTAAEKQGRRRWPSRPRSPAASRSSRRCARAWSATASGGSYGILNGTCNYILTTMRETEARLRRGAGRGAGGWATPRPTRASTSTASTPRTSWRCWPALAFGRAGRFRRRACRGHPPRSRALDIAFADELGYRIKLLGLARETPHGIEQRVHPCMVPPTAPIAHVEGVFNAVVVEGDFVGTRHVPGPRRRGRGRPPRPWSPTWSTSRAAATCRPSSCRRRSSPTAPAVADGAPCRRLLHAADGAGSARRHRRRHRRPCAKSASRWNRCCSAAGRAGRGGAGGADHARDAKKPPMRARAQRASPAWSAVLEEPCLIRGIEADL